MLNRTTRTPLSRAIGLGSAKSGVGHWWAERLSAVALVPLSLWFVASLIAHSRSGYGELITWLKSPATVILMVLLLIASFHHTAAGLQVIVEDYVHSSWRFAVIALLQFLCTAFAVVGILSVLKIVFAG